MQSNIRLKSLCLNGNISTCLLKKIFLRRVHFPTNISDFRYELPQNLIARFPSSNRSSNRLLYLNGSSGATDHFKHFTSILDIVQAGDLMVFNNTKVIPARLFGKKETGGKIEALVERIIDDFSCLVHLKASRSPQPGTKLFF